MLIHHKELHILDNSQKEDYGITSHPHEQDKNDYVFMVCQKHGHDEKSRSMNTSESGYYEKDVAELIISDDRESRQRFIIRAETIQQDSDTDFATHHRKIDDVIRYPELTASNNNKSNDIKDRVEIQ